MLFLGQVLTIVQGLWIYVRLNKIMGPETRCGDVFKGDFQINFEGMDLKQLIDRLKYQIMLCFRWCSISFVYQSIHVHYQFSWNIMGFFHAMEVLPSFSTMVISIFHHHLGPNVFWVISSRHGLASIVWVYTPGNESISPPGERENHRLKSANW